MKFIEEPVEIEEGGGELVEYESGAVEVDERSLVYIPRISHALTLRPRTVLSPKK